MESLAFVLERDCNGVGIKLVGGDEMLTEF